MTIEQFIEKAIRGKWQPRDIVGEIVEYTHTRYGVWLYGKDEDCCHSDIHNIVLDSKAWQAVSKVEKWGEVEMFNMLNGKNTLEMCWKYQMHCMIDALTDGKSIEEFIEKLGETKN